MGFPIQIDTIKMGLPFTSIYFKGSQFSIPKNDVILSLKIVITLPKVITIPYVYSLRGFKYTVKPVLSGHSKIDKAKILMINGSLMKVESIAECSLVAFCNTFDLH